MVSFGKQLDDSRPCSRQKGARYALLVLTGINLLNFADRYVPAAVKELIKDDLDLSDTETTYPTTGMIFVYMICAGIFGYIADKNVWDRRYILAAAVVLWSLATALAGLAQNLTQLVLLRSLVGVGEAAYSTIAPPMISDFFPHADRNIAYAIYFLAIPVGGALGFAIGSVLGGQFGWRVAFLGVGLPGVAAAVCVLLINNPVVGINDIEKIVQPNDGISENTDAVTQSPFPHREGDSSNSADNSDLSEDSTSGDEAAAIMRKSSKGEAGEKEGVTDWQMLWVDIWAIFSNRYFMCCLLGSIANNFALGGLADWFPSFLVRYNNISISEAGIIVGAATVLGGIGGNLLGAKSAQYFDRRRVHNSYLIVSAVYTIPAAVFLLLLINTTGNTALAVTFLFAAEICVWTCLAPITTISISCIKPQLRAKSSAMQIFFQHVLGDMISPPIIGIISDSTSSLQTGLQITWMTVALSGLSWWLGGFYLPNFDIPKEYVQGVVSEDTTYFELLMGRKWGFPAIAEESETSGGSYPNSTALAKSAAEKDTILELSAVKLNQAL